MVRGPTRARDDRPAQGLITLALAVAGCPTGGCTSTGMDDSTDSSVVRGDAASAPEHAPCRSRSVGACVLSPPTGFNAHPSCERIEFTCPGLPPSIAELHVFRPAAMEPSALVVLADGGNGTGHFIKPADFQTLRPAIQDLLDSGMVIIDRSASDAHTCSFPYRPRRAAVRAMTRRRSVPSTIPCRYRRVARPSCPRPNTGRAACRAKMRRASKKHSGTLVRSTAPWRSSMVDRNAAPRAPDA